MYSFCHKCNKLGHDPDFDRTTFYSQICRFVFIFMYFKGQTLYLTWKTELDFYFDIKKLNSYHMKILMIFQNYCHISGEIFIQMH